MGIATTSIIIVGAIGGILGLLIALSSIIFYVKEDTRVQEINELLPQFNCGACGTPGCLAMAETLVSENISVNKCRPAKPEQREAINKKLTELGIKIVD